MEDSKDKSGVQKQNEWGCLSRDDEQVGGIEDFQFDSDFNLSE